MDRRMLCFLLAAVVLVGASAAGPVCPPGFRCQGAPAPGQSCLIQAGPYKGETGTLVGGRCLRSADAGAGALHTHVIEPGRCPLCGTQGVDFLSFNVQAGTAEAPVGARLARYEQRRLMRCPTCGNLFADPDP